MGNKVDHLSADRSSIGIGFKKTGQQLKAATTKVVPINGQLVKKKRVKEEARQNASAGRYTLYGTKARITLFEGSRESRAG